MKKLLIALLLVTFFGSNALAAETAVMASTSGSVPEGSTSAAVSPAKVKKTKKHQKKTKKAKKRR